LEAEGRRGGWTFEIVSCRTPTGACSAATWLDMRSSGKAPDQMPAPSSRLLGSGMVRRPSATVG